MRVLHFLPAYAPAWQFGGPILSVSRLCESLVRYDVDVRVITTNAGIPGFPPDKLCLPQYVKGVQVIYYPVDSHTGPIRSKQLIRSLPQHMFWADILHISSIWQPLGISVQNAAHKASVPVIQTLRGALGPYSWRRAWWKKIPYFFFVERPLLQRAASIHCTTVQEALEIQSLGLRPPLEILPNPVDLSQSRYDPIIGTRWSKSTSITTESTLFLVLGRMHHKKGLDLLPFVFNNLSHLPWNILFIGNDDDGTLARLKRSFQHFGLSHRCHWLNALPSDELIGPYNAADWLLLPSHHENFGNVVVEALACGCGVVASSSVGSANDLHDCPGVYVLNRSKREWTQLISKLISTPKPKSRSSAYVQHTYDQNNIAKSAVHMYSRALSPKFL